MAEYISREAVNNLIEDMQNNRLLLVCERTNLYILKSKVAELPAADVQPAKRGQWIETHISLCKWIPEDEKEEGHSFYMAEMKCSCCKRYNTQTFSLTLKKPDFCQHCGARMDGDTE